MKILFPYLARWRSANRSRYHQLLSQLCLLGHQVYVLKAPPMALNDLSAADLEGPMTPALPGGLTLIELYASPLLKTFWRLPIPKTKLLKKGLLALGTADQVRRFVGDNQIDVLLVYNLPQVRLLSEVDCHKHFDLADDLVAMMDGESGALANVGGMAVARRVQSRMLAHADTVTTASAVLAEQLTRPAFMLPNGADLDTLDRADGGEWRAANPGPCAGFVGAFEYWVDIELMLRVAARLPRVTFLFVGTGRCWGRMRQEVARRGLRNVRLTGAASYQQAMNYVAAMDVCLLPFKRDAVSDASCPLKLFEYAGLRKPVVSTATREVSRIGRGWVAFADEADSFAAAVENFLADPALARRAGEEGRALTERAYNWPLLARQFVDFIQRSRATLTVPSHQPETLAIPHDLVAGGESFGLAPNPGSTAQ
jgi:glycosyltransferase involved in cell wall biosynthesis